LSNPYSGMDFKYTTAIKKIRAMQARKKVIQRRNERIQNLRHPCGPD
jgi:hypothetical protein